MGHGTDYCKSHSAISDHNLAVGLPSYFALHYPWVNILYWLPRILYPLHYTIGALAKIIKKMFGKFQARCTIPWRVSEISTK